MSNRLKELRERRGAAVAQMRALTDKAEAESRDLTGEELAQHGRVFAEVEGLRAQIEAAERTLEAERQAAASAGAGAAEGRGAAGEARGGAERGVGPRGAPEYRAAFARFLAHGRSELSGDEIRALSAGAGTQGGFTLVPEQMVRALIQAVDDAVWIRQAATVIPVTGTGSLGVPSLDADPSDAEWTSELATGGEDSAMAFGKRKMNTNPVAKRIKVSNDLLRMVARGAGVLDIEALVRNRLAYKFGVTLEKAYMLGDGAGKPLGVFVASADGIPAARDVSSGNTTTAIGMDGLKSAKYSLKDQYRARASWLFHRDAVAQISKLKDSNGQYLWAESTKDGEPDKILGLPVRTSEFVPSTFTTGKYVGLLGDFAHYWIADSGDLEIQRLVELYAEANQTGFIGRAFTDGAPVLAEAFARIKLS